MSSSMGRMTSHIMEIEYVMFETSKQLIVSYLPHFWLAMTHRTPPVAGIQWMPSCDVHSWNRSQAENPLAGPPCEATWRTPTYFTVVFHGFMRSITIVVPHSLLSWLITSYNLVKSGLWEIMGNIIIVNGVKKKPTILNGGAPACRNCAIPKVAYAPMS